MDVSFLLAKIEEQKVLRGSVASTYRWWKVMISLYSCESPSSSKVLTVLCYKLPLGVIGQYELHRFDKVIPTLWEREIVAESYLGFRWGKMRWLLEDIVETIQWRINVQCKYKPRKFKIERHHLSRYKLGNGLYKGSLAKCDNLALE